MQESSVFDGETESADESFFVSPRFRKKQQQLLRDSNGDFSFDSGSLATTSSDAVFDPPSSCNSPRAFVSQPKSRRYHSLTTARCQQIREQHHKKKPSIPIDPSSLLQAASDSPLTRKKSCAAPNSVVVLKVSKENQSSSSVSCHLDRTSTHSRSCKSERYTPELATLLRMSSSCSPSPKTIAMKKHHQVSSRGQQLRNGMRVLARSNHTIECAFSTPDKRGSDSDTNSPVFTWKPRNNSTETVSSMPIRLSNRSNKQKAMNKQHSLSSYGALCKMKSLDSMVLMKFNNGNLVNTASGSQPLHLDSTGTYDGDDSVHEWDIDDYKYCKYGSTRSVNYSSGASASASPETSPDLRVRHNIRVDNHSAVVKVANHGSSKRRRKSSATGNSALSANFPRTQRSNSLHIPIPPSFDSMLALKVASSYQEQGCMLPGRRSSRSASQRSVTNRSNRSSRLLLADDDVIMMPPLNVDTRRRSSSDGNNLQNLSNSILQAQRKAISVANGSNRLHLLPYPLNLQQKMQNHHHSNLLRVFSSNMTSQHGGGLGLASRYGSVEMLDDDQVYNDYIDSPPLDTSIWSFAGNDESENVTLMYAKHEKIPMKDFGSEVRASMDVEHLLNKSVLLLDLPETTLEDIFGKIIHEMDIQEPEFTAEQVKNALFTLDQGNQFHMLSRTVQSVCTTNIDGGTFDYDQTWICALCNLSSVHHRHVAIARLLHGLNLGGTMQDLRFIVIVIAPSKAKGTKTALETARTFATLFADIEIRQRLMCASNVEQFRHTLLSTAKELAIEQNQWRERKISIHFLDTEKTFDGIKTKWYAGRGLQQDFKRRLKHYISDYTDGINNRKSVAKLFSTVVFLYFACLLPSLSFGVLNDDNTDGAMGVKKAIIAQAIGGLFFALFGGQPMIIVMSTAALALYIKIIYRISVDFNLDFFSLYALTGIWCQCFLLLYSFIELSNIMKWATRSAEEIFSIFIALAFIVESFKALHKNFFTFYHADVCDRPESVFRNMTNQTLNLHAGNLNLPKNLTLVFNTCHREVSILHLLLMFGTLWFGMFLYNFRKTPYLTMGKRELLADYALPVAVIVMSFTGAYCFSDVQIEQFHFDPLSPIAIIPDMIRLPFLAIFAGMGLGFCLSLLFFIDQNITSAIVNNPANKLKKGSATHFDLFVVAILNIFLSIFGLPWLHGSLPHSPLHLRALADVEERIVQGRIHEVITNVRETRLASIIAHVLIALSAIFLLPYPLAYIPRAVLDGLFLYMAFTSFNGNEMFERVLLLVTEQAAYPPTHYLRRVPQRKVHLFTACQLIQLLLLCTFGFTPYPYIEMVFPMIIFSFFPIRHALIPKLIDNKFLDALDGRH